METLISNKYFWISLIVVTFFVIFRRPISEKINKIKGINKGGINFDEPSQQETQISKEQSKAAEEALAALENQHLLEQEKDIRQELKERGLKENSPDMEKVLIRYLAAAYTIGNFEKIYRIIYGSQIKILLHLNTNLTATREQLLPFYQEVTDQSPDLFDRYPFENYIQYLIDESLIEHYDDLYRITQRGRTFLSWLVNVGYSLDKSF